jgi:hypothetical protein
VELEIDFVQEPTVSSEASQFLREYWEYFYPFYLISNMPISLNK